MPTFEDIFRGKQDVLEEKIDTAHGLLAKLQAYKVITHRHRLDIEVSPPLSVGFKRSKNCIWTCHEMKHKFIEHSHFNLLDTVYISFD